MSVRKGHCTDCDIKMIWTQGGYGTPDAQGRCYVCHGRAVDAINREIDAIGRSIDAMVSGPRLAAQVEALQRLICCRG